MTKTADFHYSSFQILDDEPARRQKHRGTKRWHTALESFTPLTKGDTHFRTSVVYWTLTSRGAIAEGKMVYNVFFQGYVCIHVLARCIHMTIDIASLYMTKAGREHAGFSPDQARTQSPSANHRGVFGESHEG